MSPLLTSIIALCAIGSSSSASWSVDMYQAKCQKYFIECLENNNADLNKCIKQRLEKNK